jgi:NAD(P)-dependent dehydrogenase (short-subunit alcohol dehydrogenase family)
MKAQSAEEPMMQKTWFVTGASRGLGALIAKAAIQAGDRVIATGRKREDVIRSLGPDNDQLLSVALDVSDAVQAHARLKPPCPDSEGSTCS